MDEPAPSDFLSRPHGRDRPDAHGSPLRRSTIGDDIAAARDILRQRIVEASDVIGKVVADLPDDRTSLPDIAPFPLPAVNDHLLPDYARFLIRGYLDHFMAAAFDERGSIPLAVSGRRLSRTSRRLYEAAEELERRSGPVIGLASNLAKSYPGRGRAVYERAAATLLVLGQWNKPAPREPWSPSPDLARNVLAGVGRDKRVHLGMFVCPPVDFGFLTSERPERYLRTTMHGSILSSQVGRLRDLFRGLEGASAEVELRVFVGDTDEEHYIWHGVVPPDNLDRQALEARRERLVESVTAYLTAGVGANGDQPRIVRDGVVRVERLSGVALSGPCLRVYEFVVSQPLRYFNSRDFEAEIATMRSLWQPGAYYDGLDEPDEVSLTRIVVHKFATYAMQGALLRETEPDLVLIQNERPPLLRTRMLNAGWRIAGGSNLPVVNYFGSEDPGPHVKEM